MLGHAGTFCKQGAPATPEIIQTNLIRHYDIQNAASYPGSGTVLTDLSPQGVNGTIGGSAPFTTSGGANALQFSGGGYVNTNSSHTCANWTVGIWVKYNGAMTSGDKRIWSSHNQNDYLFRTNSCFYSSVGGVYYPGINFSPTTEWHYIVVAFNASPRTLNFYKNNTLIVSRTSNGKTMTVLNFMRYRGGGYYGKGFIGEMQWYDKQLTAAEVTHNWDTTRALYGK
tara:strand:- start:543 stop:1220 length:678 start_codon:yes stop_codon:yes gene_type:complete